MIKLILILIFTSSLFSQEVSINSTIRNLAERFGVITPLRVRNIDPQKYAFGKLLFSDKNLSLNKDVSCKTCHDPSYGTSDLLPFSIGTNGASLGTQSKQMSGDITKRNSPHLFNKAHTSIQTMFWDGRVAYNNRTQSFITPEEGLNGVDPLYSDISKNIENVLAMQALFPLINPIEMKGNRFPNLSNIEVWNKISNIIKTDPSYENFIKNKEKFNISHIANALAYFQSIAFQVNDTNFDKFLQGQSQALSLKEKKGALIFMQKARCVRCHNGPLLSNLAFQNIATPHIRNGYNEESLDDLGRYEVFNDNRFKYGFMTQPLRNVSLSPPFMHNGAYLTLMQVVDHYDNPIKAIDNYDISFIQKFYSVQYNNPFYFDGDFERNNQRKSTLAPVLRSPLNLTQREKEDLVCFLKKSLTQEKFHSQINLKECR